MIFILPPIQLVGCSRSFGQALKLWIVDVHESFCEEREISSIGIEKGKELRKAMIDVWCVRFEIEIET